MSTMIQSQPRIRCYKFNRQSDTSQPVLHKAAVLMEKINAGEALTRDEKNFITKAVNHNSFFKQSIPVAGWAFDFSEVLKRFVIKQYGQWHEVYAVDKTAIRKTTYGRIDDIIQA